MKVWITKYAMTKGIFTIEGEPNPDCDGMFVGNKGQGFTFAYFHGEGREWHRTAEGAAKHANKMKADKIHNLHRSIAKLEAKTF